VRRSCIRDLISKGDLIAGYPARWSAWSRSRISVRPVAKRANFSTGASDSVPRSGKNVKAFGPHAGRGDASSWPSTSLKAARTVKSLRPMADHPSRRRGTRYRSPGPIIRGMSACPLVCLSQPIVLNIRTRSSRWRVCRARAPTHAGEQLHDFEGQAPNFNGIVADAMEMPQVRLMYLAARRRKQGPPDAPRSTAPNPRLGAEDIPENTTPGPAVRWKAVDHLRLLRVLIGIL
jgi:hypothetical protein